MSARLGTMLIDPPSVFATTKEWTDFLSDKKRQLEVDPRVTRTLLR